jgi:hypothetical protein
MYCNIEKCICTVQLEELCSRQFLWNSTNAKPLLTLRWSFIESDVPRQKNLIISDDEVQRPLLSSFFCVSFESYPTRLLVIFEAARYFEKMSSWHLHHDVNWCQTVLRSKRKSSKGSTGTNHKYMAICWVLYFLIHSPCSIGLCEMRLSNGFVLYVQ